LGSVTISSLLMHRIIQSPYHSQIDNFLPYHQRRARLPYDSSCQRCSSSFHVSRSSLGLRDVSCPRMAQIVSFDVDLVPITVSKYARIQRSFRAEQSRAEQIKSNEIRTYLDILTTAKIGQGSKNQAKEDKFRRGKVFHCFGLLWWTFTARKQQRNNIYGLTASQIERSQEKSSSSCLLLCAKHDRRVHRTLTCLGCSPVFVHKNSPHRKTHVTSTKS